MQIQSSLYFFLFYFQNQIKSLQKSNQIYTNQHLPECELVFTLRAAIPNSFFFWVRHSE